MNASLPIENSTGELRKYTNPLARPGTKGALVTTASSLGAILLAFVFCGVLLALTGKSPADAFTKVFDIAKSGDGWLETINRATPLIIAAVAVAIGFKLNLFNIGVEGQFLMGMFVAAVVGARVSLPPVLHVTFTLLVAMLAAALWASIAGLLKIKRGVSEVIATIMLNYIALSVIDWAFQSWFRFDKGDGALDVKTKPLPTSAWMPDLVDRKLGGFIFIALLVAVAYWVIVFKSQYGFRLRASGLNPTAAGTAGISSKKMMMSAMLMSGAVAGLAGMSSLLGDVHAYGTTRPEGYGFKGIAIALLGRNHPVGIVGAALLWGFLDASSGPLQIIKIPSSIVLVIQAIIVLTVVIVNEAVTRWLDRRTTERAATELRLAGAAT